VDSGYGWIVDSSQYDVKTTNRRLGADDGVVYCLLVMAAFLCLWYLCVWLYRLSFACRVRSGKVFFRNFVLGQVLPNNLGTIDLVPENVVANGTARGILHIR
jgi:hypothetical protein